jgi:hypothetical protein
MPRILLTTRCRDSGLYDYFRENAPRNFRWRFAMPGTLSFGLRFLRQNLPTLEILEYPTRRQFPLSLRGVGTQSASLSTSKRRTTSWPWPQKHGRQGYGNFGPETTAP